MKPHPLRLAREERGWSQTKVAKELGVNIRTVGRWELRLVVPHPHYREQLSLLFGKTIEELGLLEDGGENEVAQQVPSMVDHSPMLDVLEPEHYTLHQTIADYECTQSEDLTVQQQPIDLLISDDQPPTYPAHASDHAPFAYPSRWNIGISHMKHGETSRSFTRSSWHSPLIASTMLLVVLIVTALLMAFNGLPLHGMVQVITSPIAPSPTSAASAITTSGTSYEAEASGNTITGGAKVASCAVCSGTKQVGDIGHTGTLQINNVREKTAGQYTLTIYYLYGNTGSHRNLHVTVNNKKSTSITVSAMNNWNEIGTLHIVVSLNAGNNTIEFSNQWGVTPNIDRIVISPT